MTSIHERTKMKNRTPVRGWTDNILPRLEDNSLIFIKKYYCYFHFSTFVQL